MTRKPYIYGNRLYGEAGFQVKETGHVENPISEEVLDRIFNRSSEHMEELPDSSIHLTVTSPPYNVGKEYDDDMTLEEYREFIKRVFSRK